MTQTNGYVLWRGPTRLGKRPGPSIGLIGTGYTNSSQNVKTGAMIQTWVLLEETPPVEALRSGEDAAICGGCPLRGEGGKSRGCYVNVHWAPAQVWKSWQKGLYPDVSGDRELITALHAARSVRLGAYGDPAAVPKEVLAAITQDCANWTGYTHQWRDRPDLQDLCMASVDTQEEWEEAKRRGWRTFRGVADLDRLSASEINCPASKEAGHRTTCEKCSLCNGMRGAEDARRDIAIVVHGAGARYAREVVG